MSAYVEGRKVIACDRCSKILESGEHSHAWWVEDSERQDWCSKCKESFVAWMKSGWTSDVEQKRIVALAVAKMRKEAKELLEHAKDLEASNG